MNISELISTPERERILQRLLYASRPEGLYQIAKEAKVSPSQVHKYISIWKGYGLISGTKPNDEPLVRALRLSENTHFLRDERLVARIQAALPKVKGIGLYGSWANGTNDENADIDIWIFVDRELDYLAMGRLRRDLENRLKKKLDMVVLTEGKLRELREKNPTFYYSLYHSIRLFGDAIW